MCAADLEAKLERVVFLALISHVQTQFSVLVFSYYPVFSRWTAADKNDALFWSLIKAAVVDFWWYKLLVQLAVNCLSCVWC